MLRTDPRESNVEMAGWTAPEAGYGDANAAVYDQLYPALPGPVLRMLRQLAGAGPVLELGVGTGRAALALIAAGHAVWGIDISSRMLDILRAKPAARALQVIHGDIADFALRTRFALIFSLVDTLALLPPLRQAMALACAARHLDARGVLLIECAPVARAGVQRLCVPIQACDGGLRDYRIELYSVPLADLDAMARQAGLAVHDRWRNWHGDAWQADATQCISVYRRSAAGAGMPDGAS